MYVIRFLFMISRSGQERASEVTSVLGVALSREMQHGTLPYT
jgi:hypothetical protein